MGAIAENRTIIIVALTAPLLLILVLSFCPGANGKGIKCWVCNSYNDIKCGDPFDNTTFPITDCESETGKRENLGNLGATMCRKVTQKVNGTWRFIRSCAFLGEPGIGGDERYCKRRTGTYNIYQEDCLCRGKDGCNGTTSLQIPITELCALLSAIFFIQKFVLKCNFLI